MKRRTLLLISLGALAGGSLLVLLVLYLTAPIDLPTPPAPQPPEPNAFATYQRLAQRSAVLMNDERLREAYNRIRQYPDDPFSTEATLFLQALEPIRAEYRKHLHEPSMVLFDDYYRIDPLFYSQLRDWVRAEAIDMQRKFANGKYDEGIDNLRVVLQLSKQICYGGTAPTRGWAASLTSIMLYRLGDYIEQLDSTQCRRLVEITRKALASYPPLVETFEIEKRRFLTMYKALEAGALALEELPRRADRGRIGDFRKLLNLRFAAREMVAYFDYWQAECAKPYTQMLWPGRLRHPLNADSIADARQTILRALLAHTRLSLIACAAAVRAYRIEHGKYPTTLEEAGVSDIARDPLTGSTFAYKPADTAFLLYSLGPNGVDDGGWRALGADTRRGDISPIYPRQSRYATPLAQPAWLK